MPLTANERIRDGIVGHLIGLQRVSTGLRDKIHKLLNDTEADLRRAIEDGLSALGTRPFASSRALQRLEALERDLRSLRGEAFSTAYDELRESLEQLVAHEPDFMKGLLEQHAPVVLETIRPDVALLTALVKNQPLQGRTLERWMRNLQSTDIERINSQIRLGLVQGETGPQITRRVLGTRPMNGADGVTEMTRREASTITRTAVNGLTQAARDEFTELNRDIVDKELFVATLDSRTTITCASLDGHTFAIGKGPRPPMHLNCRSLRVALLGSTAIGSRPYKQSTERELLAEYTKARGFKATTRDDLPRGHKQTYDEYARRRVRELTGTTPAKTTYEEFLNRQTVGFQNEVLGKTRAELFRAGGLKLDRFTDSEHMPLSVHELAQRERAAFLKAGLDPDAF